jgi:predicted lactoylglutathione lyase
MTLKSVWLNIPVKDLQKSKQFFLDIGFTLNPEFGDNDSMVCLQITEKKFIVMLCKEETFQEFTKFTTSDTKVGSEMLISMDAESREEVDEYAARVPAAGGKVFGCGEKDGWIYGFGFTDLDGHRWNIIHMDFSKVPKKA